MNLAQFARSFSKFFRDDTPHSLNRLLVALVVVNGLLMGWYTLTVETANATDAAMIVGAIITLAGGWKGWQKSQELKSKAQQPGAPKNGN